MGAARLGDENVIDVAEMTMRSVSVEGNINSEFVRLHHNLVRLAHHPGPPPLCTVRATRVQFAQPVPRASLPRLVRDIGAPQRPHKTPFSHGLM